MMITAARAAKLREERQREDFIASMDRLEPVIEREAGKAAQVIEDNARRGGGSLIVYLELQDVHPTDRRFVTSRVRDMLEGAGFEVEVESIVRLRVSW